MTKTGRPSKYSAELVDQICEHLSEGYSLRSFCLQGGNPSQSMVYRWLAEHAEFREKYTRAREDQAETFADQITDIADTEEDPQRARVRIDARKWFASKLQPKKYGEKVTSEVTGKDGGPIETKDVSDIEAAQRVAYMLGQAIARQRAKADATSTEA